MKRAFLILGFAAICFFLHCTKKILSKEKAAQLNLNFSNKVFVLLEDFKQDGELVYPKGARLRIYFESKPTLLIMKAFPEKDDREEARAKMLDYKKVEDLEKKEWGLKELEDWISQKLKEADPNPAPKKIK
jgi:type II secretion system-associated lipoprotein